MEFRQNDEYLVCDECGKQCMYGDCPHHGPLEWIDDNHSVSGAQQKNQARATLPSNLYLMPSAVGQGQMGVFTRARIEKRVMFGPFKGTNISAKEFNCGEHHNYNMYMWDILEGGKVSHIVDGSDEQSSNWMRFVNCARDSKEQNLVAVQFRGEIYYKTCNPVESGSELLVWYDDSLSLESSTQKDQSGHDFVCDACGLSFPGSTFLIKHKSVRCKETPADHGSSAEDQEDQADKPMESSDNAALSTDAELTYVVIPIEATCNEDNTQASISCDQEVQADVPGESSETAKTNQEDDTLLCDTDSPYVVHIGTPSCENSTTVVEENSSFCIVHVRPVPSSEVSNTRRLRKGKQGTAPVVNGKTPKITNTRKRSIESVGKAKQITRKSALSKARKTPSKGTKAQNAAPKKSVTASAGTKRNATSYDVSKPQVKKRKVTQPKESQGRKKAKKGKGSSMREKTKNNAAEDESMGENGAEKQLPKARKKSKKSSNLKSSSLGEEEGTVAAAEDGRADKRPRKKKPRKTRTGTVQETDEDRIDPSTTPSPTKRRRNSPKEKLTFTCEQCLRTFKWKSQLDYHMRSHATEKEFKCTFCDKGLSQLSSLKRHLRVHSGEKPFECDECGKRFVEKGKLTVHLRTHAGHPPEKKYKCSVCDRGFTLSANLRTHVRTHTGEKPYPCPQCGKGFKRSSDIISHLRSHTGERPYKCSHCPKAFTMISHRNRHELTHSGKRPFKCDLCGKRFTQANSVKAHLNVHARKQARLEGRGIAEERQETSRDEEMLADEQHVLNEAQRNGLQETGVATGEGHRTEELQGVITQLMETEHVQEDSSHAHNHKIDGAQLLQLGDSSGVDGLVEQEISSRDGTELRTIATEQLQLSCTTDSSSEQLNIDNTLINGKELLQLGSATQVDSAGHQQVELAPSNVQEQVQLAEGNETTLLAL